MSQQSVSSLPKTGLVGLKENWRSDLLSGFLVFLIALPLCLAIAKASEFPPSAGLITAMIGGILVSRVNGSFVTINGPAAGLIVVVLSAVQELGQGNAAAGYHYALAAIVVASVIQILLGVFKAGTLSSFFPASVVHGMLAAIGITIMTKQIHVMLGVTVKGSLFETMGQIPHSFINMNHEIAIIGFSSLGILILWAVIKNTTLKMIPAPLVVVLIGIGLAKYFDLDHEHMYLFLPDASILPHHEETIGPKFLVAIPESFTSIFTTPDFGKIATLGFWEAVIAISLVGSLESLLSATAVDKLDPYKRKSNLDRDLTAVGFGNLLAGLIGGLPMIAEIVRSSANVNNGAKTSWANFFHGLFLLIFVAFFPKLIHSIPLSALAALLVFTGYRLASPQSFKHVLKIGTEQFALFVITIISVLATDLLVGVCIGIVAKLAIHIIRGVPLNNLFKISFELNQENPEAYVLKLQGSAIFSNFLPMKKALNNLEAGKTILIDLSEGFLIDHTVMEFLHDFTHDYEAAGGHCEKHGAPIIPFSGHALAARIMSGRSHK